MAAADGALGARLAGSRTPSSLGSSRSYIRLVQACQRQIRLGSYLSARDCLLSVACARARGLAGSKPLQIWERKVQNGHIKRITDNDIQSSVLEIMSTNISTTFVSCPADAGKTLGIKLPFLVMIIKNVRAARPPCAEVAPRCSSSCLLAARRSTRLAVFCLGRERWMRVVDAPGTAGCTRRRRRPRTMTLAARARAWCPVQARAPRSRLSLSYLLAAFARTAQEVLYF